MGTIDVGVEGAGSVRQSRRGQPYHESVFECLIKITDFGHLLVYLSTINSSELF